MSIERADLCGPRVRVLNIGGATNPDVLQVRARDGRLVAVKDYSRRSEWVRSVLGPRLIDREIGLIRAVQGVPGVPRAFERIDREAFAIEWIEGQPLRRRSHAGAIPESFFLALEAMLEALRFRGVFYADLRSPTNVLCTPDWAPALVDLASCIRVRIPRSLVELLNRRALAKLRSRFEAREDGVALDEVSLTRPAVSELRAGRDRIRRLDLGSLCATLPVVILVGSELGLEALRPVLEAGVARGHRVIGIEVDAARDAHPLAPNPRETAASDASGAWLARCIHALRIDRFCLVAIGPTAQIGESFMRGSQAWRASGLLTLADGKQILAGGTHSILSEKSFALEAWNRCIESGLATMHKAEDSSPTGELSQPRSASDGLPTRGDSLRKH